MTKYAVNYTVTMQDENAWEEEYIQRFQNEKAARTHADKIAKENPNKLVFVSFFRKSDGQHGYINRDGADITGISWTKE